MEVERDRDEQDPTAAGSRANALTIRLPKRRSQQLLIHLEGIKRQPATLDARLAEIAGRERWSGQVQILTRFAGSRGSPRWG